MERYDFSLETTEILVNPRISEEKLWPYAETLDRLSAVQGHFLLFTSGTTGDYKLVALSKTAVLNAADSANLHLESSPGSGDLWLHCLPDYHVGGLGIWARAERSQSPVVKLSEAWDPLAFASAASEIKATLTSLVPTQVHDLIQADLRSPESLRAIVVGGAALAPETYRKARGLGWPLLPSFGMTEAASQIATAALSSLDGKSDFPDLIVLSHLEVETPDSKIRIRGNSLLTGYIHVDENGELVFTDPKNADRWLATEDFGEVRGNTLQIIGRVSERIKIGGELVNLARLREILSQAAESQGIQNKVAIIALPDERLESIVALCIEPGVDPTQLKAEFDKQVMPYEKIRGIKIVSEIPRTELGKVKWSKLVELGLEQ